VFNLGDNPQPYSLSILASQSFKINRPQSLRFDIRDTNNGIYKSFDTSNDYPLMLYVIRKDRTNFQHIHPTYDPSTGTFTVDHFQLTSDGPYRLFAQFIAQNAKLDQAGNKITSAPYVDISVGSKVSYRPVTPLAAKLVTSADGFDTNVFFAPSDDSPGAPVSYYTSNTVDTVAIEINKNGAPYTNLQMYNGSIARIAAFGPNLEFSATNAIPLTGQQTGLAIFNLPLTKPGLYILYMQTQADDITSTYDYNVTVKDVYGSSAPVNR
jgi:hypothetical protein